MDFPTWLRIKMAERNVNQDGLARLLDVSHVAVGRWTRGENTPTYENCLRIAQEFGLPAEEVLKLAGRPVLEQVPESTPTHPALELSDDPTFLELYRLMKRLSPQERQEILEYALFRERRRSEEPSVSAAAAQAGSAASAKSAT